jgi:hypothetical protein
MVIRVPKRFPLRNLKFFPFETIGTKKQRDKQADQRSKYAQERSLG